MKLIKGNCIDELGKMPSKSVDLVFTSPPYNMNLRIRNGKYCSRQIVKELTSKYEGFDDNLTLGEYFNFNKKVISECLRVSNIVFYNVQILTGNKPAIFKLIGEFSNQLKEFIIWDKVNAQPAIGKNVLNSQFEVILVFENSKPESRAFDCASFARGELSNLWQIKRGKKTNKAHGSVFPLELAKKVISNFTKEGDTVLDPFMGTGTTGEACKNLGRNFVGVELLEQYYQFSVNRLLEASDLL